MFECNFVAHFAKHTISTMKKTLFLLACLLMWATCASAQSSYRLGYCPDELPADAQAYGVSGATNRLSAAICLPKSKMLRYKGGSVKAIRFAVKAEGLSSASVWLRSNLNERSRVVQSVGTMADGWNEVELTRPLEIDGNDLYVGYTVAQAEGAKGILSAGTGTEYTSFIATDNQWQDMHRFGVDALLIQAVVEANVPTRDVTVVSLDAADLQPAENALISWNVTIENLGQPTAERIKVSYLLDNAEVSADQVSDLATEETRALSFSKTFATLTPGAHELAAAVSFEGDADENTANDTLRRAFFVYAESYPRNVLLEHFTSIPCVNCPETDKLLEEVVPTRQDIIWTAHHVGYRDDEFTLEAARPLTAFGVIGNPEVMFDRTVVGSSTTAAFALTPGDVDALKRFVAEAAAHPAFAKLSVEATAADGTISVGVEGEAADFFSALHPATRLCLYVVEDGCTASYGQAGNPTKFTHDNIVRAIPTTLQGQTISWDDTHFSQAFNISLDEAWNVNNLRLVAFLCDAPAAGSGLPTGAVLNAAQTSLTPAAAIAAPTQISTASSATYDLQGRRVVTPRQGIYVVGGKKVAL